MVNSFSDGKGRLVEPPYGSYVDSWQQPVNSNFGLTDALVSGTTTLNTSSLTPSSPFWTLVFQDFDTSATPWLNPLAGQNLRIVVTGALAYNATVFIPQNFPGMWLIDNQTTGSFTVTVKTTNPSSSGITPPQGYMSYIFCDGVNVRWADQGNAIANVQQSPPGTIISFGGQTVPIGYLLCDGAGVSRATYSSLFAAIGTLWGSGDGSTTFNVPNLQNMFIRGSGSSPVGTYEDSSFASHNHGVTDPGHEHVFGRYNGGVTNGTNFTTNSVTVTSVPSINFTENSSTGISIQNSGGTETRPVNRRVLYVIKT